jgi:CheY-like chemotaxis protein
MRIGNERLAASGASVAYLGTTLAYLTGVGKDKARPVLLVDDDDSILEAERQILIERGHHVVLARDGAEAMRAVSAGPLPAVIVLDIQMPGIDGPAFARELRQNLRHVPLVVVTGAPDPKHEADRCNAEAFLPKPFDADQLVRTIERFAA